MDQDPGPSDPLQFNLLRGRLQAAKSKMPPLYRQAVFDPFVETLDEIGENGFNQILLSDPEREQTAGLLLDISHAILQRGEGFEPKASAAFQEVVSDLYDGFLSVEDRNGVEPPDLEVLPPLVKYGNPDFGPYTWPADATVNFRLAAGIVNLPPANARRGLFAWSALGHETAGHDILHADNGLLREVSSAVRAALTQDASTRNLASYWATRIDETASDVLGILNMGPAPAIGLVGYFRGLSAAFGGRATLRNDGPSGDPHPADLVRGFLAAATVRQLKFSQAADWADLIDAEVEKDLTIIRLEGKKIDAQVARRSAEIVAQVIVSHPMSSLEQHALGQIQNWRDEDEEIVEQLRARLTTAKGLPAALTRGVYAAHLVAAATMAALTEGSNIPLLFHRMLDLLKLMNDKNPSFGPLRVKHPGNITRDRTYLPFGPAVSDEIRLAASASGRQKKG
ncbi:MAG TPA: hypothetical protein VJ302_19200 [Blastocatellia bacterium]|nr:hypothetical protein [Blastocatellia bacterium]